jgi:hypothetical protein
MGNSKEKKNSASQKNKVYILYRLIKFNNKLYNIYKLWVAINL